MAILWSVIAGCFAVIQGGTNNMISQRWGFSSALLLNGVVFLIFNFLLFAAVWIAPRFFPDGFLLQGRLSDYKVWWVLPGVCGFFLVTGLAVSINKVGAVQTFVVCIASQIVCGLLWDVFVEGRGLTPLRIAGTLVTLVGAVLTTLSS